MNRTLSRVTGVILGGTSHRAGVEHSARPCFGDRTQDSSGNHLHCRRDSPVGSHRARNGRDPTNSGRLPDQYVLTKLVSLSHRGIGSARGLEAERHCSQ